MNLDPRTPTAIEAADTDALIGIIDGHCAARDWDALIDMRHRCREATQRGKQLWAIDEHIRYRIALEAPAPYAGPSVTEGPTRFTLGPLPEVAATHHRWDELEPYLEQGPEREMVAHERVLWGEDLRGWFDETYVLEIPLFLEPWEPSYPLPIYEPHRADFPSPDIGPLEPVACRHASRIEDPNLSEALADLVTPWVEQSNGRLDVAAVEGEVADAIGAIGPSRAFARAIDPQTALTWMAWAAASGGAHGRRRGAAAGRFGAWWAASALARIEWPPDPRELAHRMGRLRWWLWSDGSSSGWVLRLAIEDPDSGRAWAIAAIDARIDL